MASPAILADSLRDDFEDWHPWVQRILTFPVLSPELSLPSPYAFCLVSRRERPFQSLLNSSHLHHQQHLLHSCQYRIRGPCHLRSYHLHLRLWLVAQTVPWRSHRLDCHGLPPFATAKRKITASSAAFCLIDAAIIIIISIFRTAKAVEAPHTIWRQTVEATTWT